MGETPPGSEQEHHEDLKAEQAENERWRREIGVEYDDDPAELRAAEHSPKFYRSLGMTPEGAERRARLMAQRQGRPEHERRGATIIIRGYGARVPEPVKRINEQAAIVLFNQARRLGARQAATRTLLARRRGAGTPAGARRGHRRSAATRAGPDDPDPGGSSDPDSRAPAAARWSA